MGDINGDLDIFHTIQDMLKEEGWSDLGGDQRLCGAKVNQPTCQVTAAAKETRRDYVLVNEALYPAVEAVRVHQCDTFCTHKPLQIKIATKDIAIQQRRLRKPTSAADLIADKIQKVIEEAEPKHKDTARKAMMAELHDEMDKNIDARRYRMSDAIAKKDSTRLWDLITAAVEAGFVAFLKLEGKEAAKMRGRSVVTIMKAEEKLEPVEQGQEDQLATAHIRKLMRRAGSHSTQANRLTNIAKRLQASSRPGTALGKIAVNKQINKDTYAAYIKQAISMGYDNESERNWNHTGLNDVERQRPEDIDKDGGGNLLRDVRACNVDNTTHVAKLLRTSTKHSDIAKALQAKARQERLKPQRKSTMGPEG